MNRRADWTRLLALRSSPTSRRWRLRTTYANIHSEKSNQANISQLIIIASIHQPSTTTFQLFDKLLLLSSGKTCYLGPVTDVPTYFDTIGYSLPMNTNPAEFILDLVSSDFLGSTQTMSKDQVQRIHTSWAESSNAAALTDQVSQRTMVSEKQAAKTEMDELSRPGILSITLTLLHRSFIKSYRDVVAYGIRIAMYLGMYIGHLQGRRN